jgi:hypothetical protein
MKALSCFCDEMYAKAEERFMALSWECPKHGKVQVDTRPQNHTHPPAYVPIRHEEPLSPIRPHFPTRRVTTGGGYRG